LGGCEETNRAEGKKKEIGRSLGCRSLGPEGGKEEKKDRGRGLG